MAKSDVMYSVLYRGKFKMASFVANLTYCAPDLILHLNGYFVAVLPAV